jgi:hypothetical protein
VSGKKQRVIASGTGRVFEVTAQNKDVTTLKQVDLVPGGDPRGPQLETDVAAGRAPGGDHGEITVPTPRLDGVASERALVESDLWRPTS